MTTTDESSIDFPKASLCLDVWEEVIDLSGVAKTWQLTDDAERKIVKLAKYLMGKLSIENYAVHIVGSITSNQYSKNSDVDVHFILLNEENQPLFLSEHIQKAYTQLIRDDLDNYYKLQFPGDSIIGSHPIEVYFQKNFYQDIMSVGCYDVFSRKWLVGPSFKDSGFNPYAEYYKEIQNNITSIRSQILAVYEFAILYIKSPIANFAQLLVKELDKAAELYEKIYSARSTLQPTSIEDALQKRDSKEWKIADASYKLLDKFGYIGILKDFSNFSELAISNSLLPEISERIVDIVKSKLGDKQKLDEQQTSGVKDKQLKIWIDDVRPAPNGYILVQSVNQFIDLAEKVGLDNIVVVDIDHDAGDFQKDGGDYIRILDWLEFNKVKDLNVRIHSANPVGVANMRRIIKKNNWTEIFDIIEDNKIIQQDKNQLNELEQQLDEGAKEWLSLAAICGMLAIPGIMPQNALAAQMKKIPKQEMNVNSKQVKKAMLDSTKAKSYNGMSATNIINAVARTIYAEGKDQSEKGRAAIASVIWNRAGGNPEKFISVISKRLQFSCWNKYSGGWKDSTYIFKLPYLNDKDVNSAKKIWNECLNLAIQMYNKTFKSTIGNRNSYMNKEKADKKNIDSWGDKLDLKIDDQHFGYTRNNDGFIQHSSQQQIYIVKKGDTLQKIAKVNNISIDELAAKNKIADKNKLRVGQKLII